AVWERARRVQTNAHLTCLPPVPPDLEEDFPQGDEALATIYERICQIITDQLGVPVSEIRPESRFEDDLNADSLDLVDILIRLEGEFSSDIAPSYLVRRETSPDLVFQITDAESESFLTVQDVVDFIRQRAVAPTE